MSKFTKSKVLLFGFVAVLLLGIPLSVYIIKQQEETRSQAQKATKLSFAPSSTAAAPIVKSKGEVVALDINVDPGSNMVSFVKLELNYDNTKLATEEANTVKVNDTVFPVTLEGPAFQEGKIFITLSVGSDPTKAVQSITKAVTVTFKTIANTVEAPTSVTFGNNTEILSIAGTDQASENVLLSVEPAYIQIGETYATLTQGSITSTLAPTEVPFATLTPYPTYTPYPTFAQQPTVAPQPTYTPVPTTSSGIGTSSANQSPVCQSLNIDREVSGGAPYSVTFTAVGSDADGTISNVTFNYGDGPTELVNQSGGIGSNSISVQKSHTYNNPGTYSASASLTDNQGAVSAAGTCQKTIIVLAPTIQGGRGGGGGIVTSGTITPAQSTYPSATIAKPGAGDSLLGIGVLAGIAALIGGIMFLAL